MASLEREFIFSASKQEIQNCTNIDALKDVAIGLLGIVQKQKDFIELSFKKCYLGIDESRNKD